MNFCDWCTKHIAQDKLLHFIGASILQFIIVLVLVLICGMFYLPQISACAAAFIFVLGMIKEQIFYRNRQVEWEFGDLFAGLLGSIYTFILMYITTLL